MTRRSPQTPLESRPPSSSHTRTLCWCGRSAAVLGNGASERSACKLRAAHPATAKIVYISRVLHLTWHLSRAVPPTTLGTVPAAPLPRWRSRHLHGGASVLWRWWLYRSVVAATPDLSATSATHCPLACAAHTRCHACCIAGTSAPCVGILGAVTWCALVCAPHGSHAVARALGAACARRLRRRSCSQDTSCSAR